MPAESGRSPRGLELWLAACIALVFAMVVVGGITRLTGSGLSIVEWAPIMGAIPPLGEAEWQRAFEAYKQYPQFRLTNPVMGLAEFKGIFFWEYVHRLLGRGIGVVFGLPLLWFWVRGVLSRRLKWQLALALVLGGMQGLVGWLMVKSGLVDEPRVSHYRLAAHLGLALAIMGWLAWILLGLRQKPDRGPGAPLPRLLMLGVAVLTALQILYGAFVAGLRAGWGYNTFPRMGERWIAEAVMALDPWWHNLVESHATVQFIHRVLGTLLLVAVALLWVRSKRVGPGRPGPVDLLFGLVVLQYLLGVYTLVNVVPLVPAVMHQGGAALVLLALVAVLRENQVLAREASA